MLVGCCYCCCCYLFSTISAIDTEVELPSVIHWVDDAAVVINMLYVVDALVVANYKPVVDTTAIVRTLFAVDTVVTVYFIVQRLEHIWILRFINNKYYYYY